MHENHEGRDILDALRIILHLFLINCSVPACG